LRSVAASSSRRTQSPQRHLPVDTLDRAHVGDPYQAALSSSGSPTWTVTRGKLPPGLGLNAGTIAGVPTLAGAYAFTVQAKDGGATATRGYTIFVSPPTSTGYDDRVNQELVQRAVGAQPGSCNKTGDLSNAIATIQLGQEVADANARLAALKISEIGDGKSCNPAADQSMNNLMLSMLIRPYELYGSTSSFYPGQLTTGAENNLVAQMWAYAKTYSHVARAADTWKLYGSENHDAQAESFYYLAAQIFSHRSDYRNRKYNDAPRSRSSTGRGTTTGATTSTSEPNAGCSSRSLRRSTTSTRSRRSSTSTTSPTTLRSGSKPAWCSTSTSPTLRSKSSTTSGAARRAAPIRRARTTVATTT
jgi:hypothetical protein